MRYLAIPEDDVYMNKRQYEEGVYKEFAAVKYCFPCTRANAPLRSRALVSTLSQYAIYNALPPLTPPTHPCSHYWTQADYHNNHQKTTKQEAVERCI